MSGDVDRYPRDELLALGACAILQKPFDFRSLATTVQGAVRMRNVRRDQAKTCRQRELQRMTRTALVSQWQNATKKRVPIAKPVGELIEEILRAEFS